MMNKGMSANKPTRYSRTNEKKATTSSQVVAFVLDTLTHLLVFASLLYHDFKIQSKISLRLF